MVNDVIRFLFVLVILNLSTFQSEWSIRLSFSIQIFI